MKTKHTHRVVINMINYAGKTISSTEIGRFPSEGWAQTFAEQAAQWIKETGGAELAEVKIEELA